MLPRPVTPVGILAAKLQLLHQQLETTEHIDSGFRSELRLACELAGGLDDYVSACTTPPSPALQAIAERTRAEDWGKGGGGVTGPHLEQEMLSGHVEGQTLNFLVYLSGATRVLEIGMFTGYSALAMAEALPPNGKVVACEVDAYVADLAQQCFDGSTSGKKITVRVGPALETLRQLAADRATFDFVFVDADKGNYAAYLEILLDTDLLSPRGLICVDNTLMQGLPYTSPQATVNATAIVAFNQIVADDPRLVQVILPLRDGLTLIRRA